KQNANHWSVVRQIGRLTRTDETSSHARCILSAARGLARHQLARRRADIIFANGSRELIFLFLRRNQPMLLARKHVARSQKIHSKLAREYARGARGGLHRQGNS